MGTTKVFTSGESQAVRIPQEYRFQVGEVFINKIGDTILLTPQESLAKAFDEGVRLLTDDFLCDGVPQSMDSPREIL